jgi:hypothetical protein
MNDYDPTSHETVLSREEVIKMLRRFPPKGIHDPVGLDPNDPEALQAIQTVDEWTRQGDQRVKESNNPGADLEWNLELVSYTLMPVFMIQTT